MEITISKISAAIAILTFVGFVCYNRVKGKENNLSDIIITSIAGGMLPLAFCLVLFPFFPILIGSIEEMSLQITLTGLVLIYVYSKTIFDKLLDSS